VRPIAVLLCSAKAGGSPFGNVRCNLGNGRSPVQLRAGSEAAACCAGGPAGLTAAQPAVRHGRGVVWLVAPQSIRHLAAGGCYVLAESTTPHTVRHTPLPQPCVLCSLRLGGLMCCQRRQLQGGPRFSVLHCCNVTQLLSPLFRLIRTTVSTPALQRCIATLSCSASGRASEGMMGGGGAVVQGQQEPSL